jgi:hypothetical protein
MQFQFICNSVINSVIKIGNERYAVQIDLTLSINNYGDSKWR